MMRPPSIQAFSRVQQHAISLRKVVPSSRRSVQTTAEPPSLPPSESSLPAPPNVTDWNPVHLDMFFDRKQAASSILYSPVLRKQPLVTVNNNNNNNNQHEQEQIEKSTELIIAQDIIENDHQYHSLQDTLNDSHLFDTYEQVTHLQAWGGFSRGQAKAVMETIQNLLRISVAKQTDQFLTSSQLENESYLISAAVAEFRREVQLLRRNDSALLQSELTALTREVESLEQRLSEDLGSMRDDIELSMNDYRSDIREEQKITEHQIQGINNRLTVSLGDAATELESLKWNVIWRGLLGGLVTALGITAVGYALSALRNARAAAVQRKEATKSSNDNLTYADMELS
ncbi:hypothetical protein BDA99DRAFT_1977 [Phascolomyces articulosus]|uniref:Uncharacterized protein n=1 Tax=Phascolomyces articulosus TaxID=60185 RepID=A0AAD5PJK7_9FUNG|nr:hypothetical protein BDA99DRAFT_1977 [Phascolomyces articulosus]